MGQCIPLERLRVRDSFPLPGGADAGERRPDENHSSASARGCGRDSWRYRRAPPGQLLRVLGPRCQPLVKSPYRTASNRRWIVLSLIQPSHCQHFLSWSAVAGVVNAPWRRDSLDVKAVLAVQGENAVGGEIRCDYWTWMPR